MPGEVFAVGDPETVAREAGRFHEQVDMGVGEGVGLGAEEDEVGIAAGAGACAAINNYYDRDIDPKMRRTDRRPLARANIGRASRARARAMGAGDRMAML